MLFFSNLLTFEPQHYSNSNGPSEMSIAQNASSGLSQTSASVFSLSSDSAVPLTHYSRQALPQLFPVPESRRVSVKMQMFGHTWQPSLFLYVHGAFLLSDPAPLQLVRIWGILVAEMSYVFPPGVSCPPRSHAAFPFCHTHFLSCQPGNVLATAGLRRRGKLFLYDRYNDSEKPLLFLFIMHLSLPGTRGRVESQIHEKTN